MCPKKMRYVRGFARQNLNQLDPQTGKITQARPLLTSIGPSHRDFRMSVAEIGSIRVTEAAGYLCHQLIVLASWFVVLFNIPSRGAMPEGRPAAANSIVKAADGVMVRGPYLRHFASVNR